MTVPCAVLMCHAPIVVPAIGGPRGEQCRATTAAMERTAKRLVAHRPDVLVIISPHTPRQPRHWGIVQAQRLRGDFGRFGQPSVALDLPGAPDAAAALAREADRLGLGHWSPDGHGLDHGAMVPLHFVAEAGWNGPTLLIALPYPGTGSEAALGRAIAAAADGQRWAILASGDMSHRLIADAPAGFHPDAVRFDRGFSELIRAGELQRACAFDPALREIAAEDVVDSCLVAAAAVNFDSTGHEAYCYEGPFGVGYMEAILHEPVAPTQGRPGAPGLQDAQAPPATLTGIARDAIAAHLAGRTRPAPSLDAPWDRSRGVFVTLRRPDGSLRGCIGHIEPVHGALSQEVADCAVLAATRDTRFAPVTARELDDLRIEVSVLTPPEPVERLADLDARRWGVIVSSGPRRGLLLPDIQGVDSVEQQLAIAAHKGHVDLQAPHRIERFEVHKVLEADGAPCN